METLSGDLFALENGLSNVEKILDDSKTESLRVYDGGTGAALWIPFRDAPAYGEVLRWLHTVCAKAVERSPSEVTLAPNSHGGAPAHLHVASNAVGRFSVLPYSVRCRPDFPVAVPLDGFQLDRGMENGSVVADNFAWWIKDYAELFSAEEDTFWKQRFYSVGSGAPPMPAQKIAWADRRCGDRGAARRTLAHGRRDSTDRFAARVVRRATPRSIRLHVAHRVHCEGEWERGADRRSCRMRIGRSENQRAGGRVARGCGGAGGGAVAGDCGVDPAVGEHGVGRSGERFRAGGVRRVRRAGIRGDARRPGRRRPTVMPTRCSARWVIGR